jgi:hypothetical protein
LSKQHEATLALLFKPINAESRNFM